MKHTAKQMFKADSAATYTRFSMEDFTNELTATAGLADSILSQGSNLVKSVGMESFGAVSGDEAKEAQGIYRGLTSLLKRFGFEAHLDGRKEPMTREEQRIHDNRITSASIAAIACSNESHYIKALRKVSVESVSNDPNVFNVTHNFEGAAGSMQVFQNGQGLENYNEKSQRDYRVVTVAYNLGSPVQDEFAERVYPTTIVNPIEGGVVQILPYIAIMKDVHHAVSGVRLENKEVNMVEAYRDPSILDDSSTALIPAISPDNSNVAFFADPLLVPPVTIINDQNLSITTAPLLPGVKIDLMGNSNANLLINKGQLDISDTIDPAGRLKHLYVKFDGKVVKFKVDRMPSAVFQPALVGDTRTSQLVFTTESLPVNGSTKATDESVTAVMAQLAASKWNMRLSCTFTGHVSLSRGDARFSDGGIEVAEIRDEDRNRIDLTTGAGLAMITALGDLEVIGYELDLRFTNTNRRQRGHLLQTRALQFRHPIPMHAPVTLPMSTLDDEGPGEVVKALTVNTNLRNSNNAITRLLNYLGQLKEATGNGFDRPAFGEVEGALSTMIRTTYRYGALHLPDVIDTLTSTDRWSDVCNAILNFAKGKLFPAYRDSNIEAAFRVISGNQDEKPMFLFLADKEIGNYLMTQGDDRTLGAVLEYDLVCTNNELWDGKLVIIPTRKNPQENDILSFGQFYYVPTVIADLPITRGGNQVTREIAAIPFNLHVNNIPFAIEIDITGFQEVMGESRFNKPLIEALQP
jgi:hypothetical protein